MHQQALQPLRTLAELFDTPISDEATLAAMYQRAQSASSQASEQGVASPKASKDRRGLVLLGWQLLKRARRLPPWLAS